MPELLKLLPEQQAWMGEWLPEQPLPEAFVELPWLLHGRHPHWLGEDSAALHRQFSRSNPWFGSGRAWLGVIPEQARLAGFVSGQEVDGEKVAFFGFWESANRLRPNQQLFQALSEWAREQGATRIYGPINFTTFGAYRVRLNAFDASAFPGEPWNPAYYPQLLEELGFKLRYRYLSTFNDTRQVASSVREDYLRTKPLLERKVSLEALSPEFWMDNLDELYGFVDQVFGGNFAYSKLSLEAFRSQCGAPFAERLCPHSSVLARSLDGRIAGFFLVYPDYGPLLEQGNPQRVQAAEISYASHYPRLPQPCRALAKTGGVHPEFRELGLFTAMGCELSLRAEDRYELIAATLVREDNNSRHFAQRHGGGKTHQYGLYQGTL
jgi:GNAT superfamily N-acetyltransferase